MKEKIERIRSLIARVRRNPDASGTMTTLALAEAADCLESIDERLAKLEALAGPIRIDNMQRLTDAELHSLRSSCMPLLPIDNAHLQADWAIGSKV